MKIFLVGGAVRDALLGRAVKERDYVVVGASVAEMLALGYKPIGKDFPVFLHPQTHAEYALARSERKTEPGYKGFVFHTDPNITLEQDLKRRDLTINAIAQDESGNLYDPFNGQQDLKQKILRHVSAAFSEDPVRLLRLARFAAKLPDFKISPETFKLLQTMVNNGEVDALVPERVYKELTRTFSELDPCQGMQLLYNCGAWNKLFPMLKDKFTDMQQNLAKIINFDNDSCSRFAAWCIDLDKNLITELCNHLKVSNEYSKLAKITAYLYQQLQHTNLDSAEQRLTIIECCDGVRQPQKLMHALKLIKHLQGTDVEKIIANDLNIINALDMAPIIIKAQENDVDFKTAVRAARVQALNSHNFSSE